MPAQSHMIFLSIPIGIVLAILIMMVFLRDDGYRTVKDVLPLFYKPGLYIFHVPLFIVCIGMTYMVLDQRADNIAYAEYCAEQQGIMINHAECVNAEIYQQAQELLRAAKIERKK